METTAPPPGFAEASFDNKTRVSINFDYAHYAVDIRNQLAYFPKSLYRAKMRAAEVGLFVRYPGTRKIPTEHKTI
jgi:hypothetical protein